MSICAVWYNSLMDDFIMNVFMLVIMFGILSWVILIPLLIVYPVITFIARVIWRSLHKKRSKGRKLDEEANRVIKKKINKVVSIVLGALFVLCMGTLVILFIVDSTPQSVLRRNLNDYDFFLKGRKIDSHETMPLHPQDSIDRIRTSIDVEKIPRLLETNILKACERDEYNCSDPIWYNKDGRHCTRAEWKKNPKEHYIEACVSISSGEFWFQRIDI